MLDIDDALGFMKFAKSQYATIIEIDSQYPERINKLILREAMKEIAEASKSDDLLVVILPMRPYDPDVEDEIE